MDAITGAGRGSAMQSRERIERDRITAGSFERPPNHLRTTDVGARSKQRTIIQLHPLSPYQLDARSRRHRQYDWTLVGVARFGERDGRERGHRGGSADTGHDMHKTSEFGTRGLTKRMRVNDVIILN